MWTILLVGFALVLAVAEVVRLIVHAHTVRVVHCPATGGSAALTLSPNLDPIGRGAPAVKQCSLWPDREHCAQACLAEIHESAEGCAFRRQLASWYRNRHCVLCRRPIPRVSAGGPQPGLLSPLGQLLQWRDVPPARLFEILKDHHAVCANCAVAEDFRSRFPERVVERPPRAM
jgi:hypothetical protein